MSYYYIDLLMMEMIDGNDSSTSAGWYLKSVPWKFWTNDG